MTHPRSQPDTNPSQNAVTGSSGTHPVPEGAADNAPPAMQFGVQSAEQVAKIFAYLWDGNATDWRDYLPKAEAFLSYPLSSAEGNTQ